MIKKGIKINDIKYIFDDIKLIKKANNSWYQVILTEGKNREIRNVFSYFKAPVSRIIRTEIGKFKLTQLENKLYKKIDHNQLPKVFS